MKLEIEDWRIPLLEDQFVFHFILALIELPSLRCIVLLNY